MPKRTHSTAGSARATNVAIAKAAKTAAETRDRTAIPWLVADFQRLLANPMQLDKGCIALTEIAAALYTLDHYDAELLLAGIRHRQPEPSFGGTVDTAIQLRSHCALGLAQSRHPDAAFELVGLLADREAGARAGAVRGIGMLPTETATLLIRYKVLIGDPAVEVIAECFANLLTIDPIRSLRFVSGYCDAADEAVAEAAVLALGDSRLPDAVEALKDRWTHFVVGPMKKILLLALATARRETSVEFLLKLLKEESPRTALDVLHALRIYRDDETVWKQVGEIVNSRDDRALMDSFLTLSARLDR